MRQGEEGGVWGERDWGGGGGGEGGSERQKDEREITERVRGREAV